MCLLQLCYHPNATNLKKKCSIYTKTNEPLSYFLVGQTSILHKGLNNHKDEIICISTPNNTVHCEKYMYSFPCLFALDTHGLKSMINYY